MPAYPLRALVLRKTKLGEADFILTMLAADGRQVRAVAKGARKTRSKLGARVEPLTVLDLLLHSGRTLEVIGEAEIVASHDRIRRDLDRMEAASVVADMLDKVSIEGQAEPQLYAMALVTLDEMETAPQVSLRALVLAFLLKALAMQGYRPVLDSCAACGSTGAFFSPEAGGILCADCAREDLSAMPVSNDACAVMRALLRSRMAEVPGLDIPPELTEEVMRVVFAFARYHIPARLKALELYARSA